MVVGLVSRRFRKGVPFENLLITAMSLRLKVSGLDITQMPKLRLKKRENSPHLPQGVLAVLSKENAECFRQGVHTSWC